MSIDRNGADLWAELISGVSGTDGEVELSSVEEADRLAFEEDCRRQLALHALVGRTGYTLLQENGQRMYGGPPPGWEGPPPPRGCEVFVGKVPRDMYEDELVPLFERVGRIYELRLMMEFSGENRGYAFVMFTHREAAQKAISLLDNFEVRPKKFIGVCVSVDNCRLFIGGIPKDKKKEQILEEMNKVTEGVSDVIVYPNTNDVSMNRGFAFVEYKTHKAAALARRKLIPGTFQLWGHTLQVGWAEPEGSVDNEVMQRIRVLHVRNVSVETCEETLFQEFSSFKPGSVERIKKLGDYAFVHYRCRGDALTALQLMNGAQIDGATLEVTLAKPAAVKDGKAGRKGRGFTGRSLMAAPLLGEGGGAGRADWGPPPGPPAPLGKHYPNTAEEAEPLLLPLLPGTQLSPSSLLFLKHGQIFSAVTLLEYFCSKLGWSPPQYYLFSTPDPAHDGMLLLLYKVVLPSTQSTFVPTKLCPVQEHAKELAAQTTLWHLDPSLLTRVTHELPRSPSPPLSVPPSPGSSPVVLRRDGRGFNVSVTPPPPLSAPPSQSQGGVYFSSSLRFY